jgi:uncharacterized LabA/DUF88 family protein
MFIDGSNIFWGLKDFRRRNNVNDKIDFKKLVDYLLDKRDLTRAIYYCSKPIPPAKASQIGFYDYLRHIGIQVIDKPLKTRYDPITKKTRTVEKGVDVALAVDLIGMAWEGAYEVAILVSGDEDYLGAVNKVMSKGKNVELVTFRNFMSKELKQACIKVTVLDDIWNLIKLQKS